MDMEKIMAYVEKIAENLEGLVCAIGCDSMPSCNLTEYMTKRTF